MLIPKLISKPYQPLQIIILYNDKGEAQFKVTVQNITGYSNKDQTAYTAWRIYQFFNEEVAKYKKAPEGDVLTINTSPQPSG